MNASEGTIQLRQEDLALLYAQVAEPGLLTRDVSGFDNNLTEGRAHWGSAEQPFLRLTPARFEAPSPANPAPNAVRTTSADGVTPLPNPRLVSNVIGQQAVDSEGATIPDPNPFGTNLLLMSFGQFFDHGLDFYARGGGSFLVPIGDMNEQLAAAQARLNQIRAQDGLPPVEIDLSDNILAQLEDDPAPFEFLIGSRAGRYDVAPDGSVVTDADGAPLLNNATGVAHLNKTAPFVDQSQTYGSSEEMLYLLRESARTPSGDLIADGAGGWVKTHRLLDGQPEIGPDGVARGSLPTYADVLVNNGVGRDVIEQLLADVAGGNVSDFEAWTSLQAEAGFVHFGDIGDVKHTIMLGDKNDAIASPVGHDGVSPNPGFSLDFLLSHYIAGDHRVNENVALTSVHVIWQREHNFQAERIKALQPDWSDEEIFQAAKIVQTAQYQRIVFTEFAEALSGGIPGPSHGFGGYDPDVNPGISDEFAGAMYRVGHSMINETIPFTDASGETQEIPLFSAFLNPAMYAGQDPLTGGVGGAAAIIGGEIGVHHQTIDEQIVGVIHSQLLGQPLDLFAANLVRARELGVPGLKKVREDLYNNGSLLEQAGQASNYTDALPETVPSLKPYETWAEFGANLRGSPSEQAELLALFKAVYGEDDIHVNDVELFIGGLAEAPVGASQMGSTFTWIFNEQLDRLQEGDRHYYFNQLKDAPLLLADIGSQHFSDLVMRNTGLEHLHHDVFKVARKIELDPLGEAHDFSDHPVSPDEVLVLVGSEGADTVTGTAGDDAIYGEGGSDILKGGLGLDALYGGDGDDVLEAGASLAGVFAYGEAGDDVIVGADGGDNLIGGAGDDWIRGGSGADFLSGGDGQDRLKPGPDPNLIDGGPGQDTVDYSDSSSGVTVDLRIAFAPVAGLGGYAQGDVMSGVEHVAGSSFADVLFGDDGRNRMAGGDGDDMLDGGGGRDALIGGAGADTLLGGGGGDRLRGGAEIDFLRGDAGDDVILGGDGNDNAEGGAADDTIFGNDGNDLLTGHDDRDRIDGGAGDDIILGDDRPGIDVAGPADDELQGGTGNDTILGGQDSDAVDGGAGNDLIDGGAGDDCIVGHDGDDYLVGDFELDIGTGAGHDTIGGGAGNDTVFGGDGDDSLSGGEGDDIVLGERGDDRLFASPGTDFLVGGEDADRFVFGHSEGDPHGFRAWGTAVVVDFSIASSDRLVFSPEYDIDELTAVVAGSDIWIIADDGADHGSDVDGDGSVIRVQNLVNDLGIGVLVHSPVFDAAALVRSLAAERGVIDFEDKRFDEVPRAAHEPDADLPFLQLTPAEPHVALDDGASGDMLVATFEPEGASKSLQWEDETEAFGGVIGVDCSDDLLGGGSVPL